MNGHDLYLRAGAHVTETGVRFSVWAPRAANVTVLVEGRAISMKKADEWFSVSTDASVGDSYFFEVETNDGRSLRKFDPYGRHFPNPASLEAAVVAPIESRVWEGRSNLNDRPLSVYEVHLGSWRRPTDGTYFTYDELAEPLIEYVRELGFTHVEFLPLAEHPFYASWGYQPLGFFAPTSRYGDAIALRRLVDRLHDADIGVLLDFVPSHFPMDDWGLVNFDGEALFEHPDRRRGFHPDWNSAIFNYDDPRVRAFLISAACFWLDEFAIDGLRVDAVASMLYLDYSRQPGEWLPNKDGGVENYGAIEFLRELNDTVHREFPGAITIAEESTAWPGVTAEDGLRFDYKWDMGWMNDTLVYFAKDPVYRKHHHRDVTFRALYAGSENFILALSHDEVVHAKGSIFGKMAGVSEEEKLRHVRLMYAFMFSLPGAKHLFMGMEFAQRKEWNHDGELEWDLLKHSGHREVQDTLATLTNIYASEVALQTQHSDATFSWIRVDDANTSILVFERRSDNTSIVCVFNFTSVNRQNFRVGVPFDGDWGVLYATDFSEGSFVADPVPADRGEFSVEIDLNGLSALFLKSERTSE